MPRAALNSDYTLMQSDPLSRAVDVVGTSYTRSSIHRTPEHPDMRSRDTRLPRNRNPRTEALARELRSAHADDMEFVQAVLAMFTQQPFFYTLEPAEAGGRFGR